MKQKNLCQYLNDTIKQKHVDITINQPRLGMNEFTKFLNVTNEAALLHQTDQQVQATLLDFNQIKHLFARITLPLKVLVRNLLQPPI